MVRVMLFTAGVLGAFAAADAVVLFLFFGLATLLFASPGPYASAVMFLGLPVIAMAGGAVAWTAYLALHEAD